MISKISQTCLGNLASPLPATKFCASPAAVHLCREVPGTAIKKPRMTRTACRRTRTSWSPRRRPAYSRNPDGDSKTPDSPTQISRSSDHGYMNARQRAAQGELANPISKHHSGIYVHRCCTVGHTVLGFTGSMCLPPFVLCRSVCLHRGPVRWSSVLYELYRNNGCAPLILWNTVLGTETS